MFCGASVALLFAYRYFIKNEKSRMFLKSTWTHVNDKDGKVPSAYFEITMAT